LYAVFVVLVASFCVFISQKKLVRKGEEKKTKVIEEEEEEKM
jgi:hypothetical protein